MRNLKVYKSVDKVPSDTNIISTLSGQRLNPGFNSPDYRLHYDRASQFGLIHAYCKSSLVNVFAIDVMPLCAKYF
ncbi:hypothetical protein H8356DRAFT_1352817 [Neocallimastix lanati (nom. inval.)]|nr:hypothetical protein H8356DRAFT_1352817 [Neocallimastix sp. JGI-2020a]